MRERTAEELLLPVGSAVRIGVAIASFVAGVLIAYFTGATTAEQKMRAISKEAAEVIVDNRTGRMEERINALRSAQDATNAKLDRLLEMTYEEARRERRRR